MIKKMLKRIPILVKIKTNMSIFEAYRKDYKTFKKYWIEGNINVNTTGYKILLDVHSIEKGLTSKETRYFGVNKITNIIKCLKMYDSNNWNQDYAYSMGMSILKTYTLFYEKNNWVDREEYKLSKNFIEEKKYNELNTGCYEIKKDDFIKNAQINYSKFLSSRHSVRNYLATRIKDDDVRKAIEMALMTPTACNRQMCKIYYINDAQIRNKTLKYAHGLTNFEIDTVNLFIITFDISSFCCLGDRHQGWFNSGLVGMNFVNALHSLGIGTCFIQFGNEYEEENEMKKIIGIPENEKVAVIISAGYYAETSTIPCSCRKQVDDIYKKI